MISIIVPIYNVDKYLERCLNSILSQTYHDIQAILIDDGSTDSSGLICDQYAKLDKRIKVIHKKNGGISSARNVGLRLASGEYIGFVDSDDYIDSEMFELLYKRSVETSADIVVCGFRSFGNKQKDFSLEFENNIMTTEAGLRRLLENEQMPAYSWNKLFKKELFDGIVFPVNQRYEDVRVMHKLFLKAKKIATVGSMPYHYQLRENSITGSTQRLKSDELIESYEDRVHDLIDTEFSALASASLLILIRRITMEIYENGDISNSYIRKLQAKAAEFTGAAYPELCTKQKILNSIFVKSPRLYYKLIYLPRKFLKR